METWVYIMWMVSVLAFGSSASKSCAIDVLSVDHKWGAYGRYFNFNKNQLDAILGRTNWHNKVFTACNARTGQCKQVVVWRKANGGSKGDAHGRINPYGAAKQNDWKVGDVITFKKYCKPKCSIDVLSVDHKWGASGKYFNFNKNQLDAILDTNNWHGKTFTACNVRRGQCKQVVVWRKANGGSKGDAHGRINPYGSAKQNDWKVGDKITFDKYCGQKAKCYPRNVCNNGYMDKTNGKSKWWACGWKCTGGMYYTDGVCNCACVRKPPTCPNDALSNPFDQIDVIEDIADEAFVGGLLVGNYSPYWIYLAVSIPFLFCVFFNVFCAWKNCKNDKKIYEKVELINEM